MRLLRQAFEQGLFLLDIEAEDLASIFQRTVDMVVSRGALPVDRRDEVVTALVQREAEISTAIGHAVAVPHAYLDVFTEPVIVFVRLAHGLNLGAPDGIPTRFFVVLLGPRSATADHLDTLTQIARLMADDQFRYEARIAPSRQGLLDALDRFIERTAVRKVRARPAVPEGLRYTGKLFGGILGDLRRRLPHYIDDFRDGLHPKCIGSVVFLYFACLAPTVTFGGVMANLTDHYIGPVEMLVASAACGVLYALVGGHPLIILSGTGPVLIFEVLLYRLCIDLQLGDRFLEVRVWVGLWTGLFLFLAAITDASCLMRYFTRFTDEIFAVLISLMFIYEAMKALAAAFGELEEAQHHATALLTLLLALGTYYIATALTRLRRSRYLLPKMREFLADFGPAIALGAMTGVAFWLHEVDLEMLPVPDTMVPTLVNAETAAPRPWLVDPRNVPTWIMFASAIPALLLAVLLFAGQNITARLINSPDHRLHKGEAYHFDMAILGGLAAACPFWGFPWLMAATVRSLNHLRSLATLEEVVTPSGETRERVIHVRENRVTALVIHLMLGASLLLLPMLKAIPMPVLYGLFLFMGVVSIAGNQFFERLSLWLMDSSLYPTTHYIRRVPHAVIHKFTLLQLICLVVLWAVMESPMGIVYPLFIALLVPIRMLADRFFKPEHLQALDAEELPEEELLQWT